jgi:hypothetical protein
MLVYEGKFEDGIPISGDDAGTSLAELLNLGIES